MKNYNLNFIDKSKTPLDIGLRVVTLMAFVAITVATLFLLTNLHGLDKSYQVVVYALITISYIAILPGFLLVVLGKAKTKLLRRSVIFVVSLAFVILIRVAWGLWQDINGVNCYGFFGNITPCTDYAWLQIAIILLLPPGFVVVIAISVLVTAGLVAESRANKRL